MRKLTLTWINLLFIHSQPINSIMPMIRAGVEAEEVLNSSTRDGQYQLYFEF